MGTVQDGDSPVCHAVARLEVLRVEGRKRSFRPFAKAPGRRSQPCGSLEPARSGVSRRPTHATASAGRSGRGCGSKVYAYFERRCLQNCARLSVKSRRATHESGRLAHKRKRLMHNSVRVIHELKKLMHKITRLRHKMTRGMHESVRRTHESIRLKK